MHSGGYQLQEDAPAQGAAPANRGVNKFLEVSCQRMANNIYDNKNETRIDTAYLNARCSSTLQYEGARVPRGGGGLYVVVV